MSNKKARVIAFYLPQYHTIPENDEWWGKGFTEWVNVTQAKPLFKGHDQPKVPSTLGYYDLTNPDVREKQAELARNAGIEGFCYWHYYFGNGKRLLETPFNQVLRSGKPNFPFCLGWANHSWGKGSWHLHNKSSGNTVLMEQKYPGKEDYVHHFNIVLEAFRDQRYITVDGKPLFLVFAPSNIPNAREFVDLWQQLAKKNGLKGIHFVGLSTSMSALIGYEKGGRKKQRLSKKTDSSAFYYNRILSLGFDAVCSVGQTRAELFTKGCLMKKLYKILNGKFNISLVDKYHYRDAVRYLLAKEDAWENVYPSVFPNWDRTPRSGSKARVWHGSTPELFEEHVKDALELVKDKSDEHKIIFLKSWNEWGEGNYIEPDERHGSGFLDAIGRNINTAASSKDHCNRSDGEKAIE